MERKRKSGSDVASRLSLEGPSKLSHNDLWLQLEAIKSWGWQNYGLRPGADGRDEENKERNGRMYWFIACGPKLRKG